VIVELLCLNMMMVRSCCLHIVVVQMDVWSSVAAAIVGDVQGGVIQHGSVIVHITVIIVVVEGIIQEISVIVVVMG